MKLKRFDYRHIICIVLSIGFILISVFKFPYALGRNIESIQDLWHSLVFYFCELILDIPYDGATVTNLSAMPFQMPYNMPNSLEEWQEFFTRYWIVFKSKENITDYLSGILSFISSALNIVLIILPLVLIFVICFSMYLEKRNNDYDKDSKGLIIWKGFEKKVYVPVKRWVKDFLSFAFSKKRYYLTWILIWSFSFNLFSILISALAYYCYFVASFDILSLFGQLYKLVFDLSPMLDSVPLVVWIAVIFVIYLRIRKRIGLRRLRHWEMKNRGFVNSLPIVVMGCGTMGSKKTTMITDMGLSQEVMFRDKAFELILENDLKFPFFPWINLENAIKAGIKHRIIYNLSTCKKFVKHIRYGFEFKGTNMQKKAYRRHLKKYGIDVGDNFLFNYDYEKYGYTYDDKLKIVNVWDIIDVYVRLYFIYTIESSLMIANYSIRTDNIISDVGNFPTWNTDFFNRDSRFMDAYSRHSHILDFDSLRLGRKVIEDNPFNDVFEFGIVLITEVGKERGNQLENKGKKKEDAFANPLNDMFDSELKMIRHSATVDNFPFARVFTDEQRPESWNANARDLCQIINMEASSESKLAIFGFDFMEILHYFLYGKFEDMYSRYRYNRGDNTLLMYWIKGIVAKVHRYYKRMYNELGYLVVNLTIENGNGTGKVREYKYRLLFKKIYSKRFSTDCHSGFFYKKSLRSNVGIEDIPEYSGETASASELNSQHSYFIEELNRGLDEYDN